MLYDVDVGKNIYLKDFINKQKAFIKRKLWVLFELFTIWVSQSQFP